MKAPHRAQHHHVQHHAVGKTPKPAGPGGPGGPMVTGGKGTATGKHVHHNHRKHQPKKARKWTPDGEVALCSARAFAESLRLATGRAVADSDVLDVYWATAGDADSGASILATAEAILARGLGGHVLFEVVENARVGGMSPDTRLDLDHALAQDARRAVVVGGQLETGFGEHARLVSHPSTIILGLALPEPHAVAVAPDGTWWSWGEPFAWPGAVVEEAWAVTW